MLRQAGAVVAVALVARTVVVSTAAYIPLPEYYRIDLGCCRDAVDFPGKGLCFLCLRVSDGKIQRREK